MRIESYTQVQQLYKNTKVKKTQQSGGVSRYDQVQISSLGKDIQTAKAAVNASADVREELVTPIKSKINNGTYQVDAGSFAEKLLKKYEESR